MWILTYSQDILYVVLAFCVLWLTIFLSWLLYYLIMAAKNLEQSAAMIRRHFNAADIWISDWKNKFSSWLSLTTWLGVQLSDLIKAKKPQTETKKSKKS